MNIYKEEYYTVHVYGTDTVLDSRYPVRHSDDALENIDSSHEVDEHIATFHVKLMKIQHLYGGHLPFGLLQRYGTDLLRTFSEGDEKLQERMMGAVDADRELNAWRQPVEVEADAANDRLAKSA